MKPNQHWMVRAKLAHDRLTDSDERERLERQYRPELDVAQYRLAYEQGDLSRQAYDRARERLLGGAGD
jgi:hypothetical protein